jgi:hypothetical protein
MEEIDFEKDFDAVGPSPLDPHIANVWLEPKTNRFIEGFDLELSATFGEEYISLEGSGFSLEVQLSVKVASIDLQLRNCRSVLINEAPSVEYLRTDTQVTTSEKGGALELGATVDSGNSIGSANASGKGRFGANTKKELIEETKTFRKWRFTGPLNLRVDGGGKFLNGEEVSNVKGWKITPDPQAEVAVVAAVLSTRSTWIHFGKVDPASIKGSLAEKVSNWFKGRSKRDRELFNLLLGKLAAMGLQNETQKDAVLAVGLLIIRKPSARHDVETEHIHSLAPGPAKRAIQLETSYIDEFISKTAAGQIELLRRLGVGNTELREVLGKNNLLQSTAKRLFIAGTAPLSALASLEFTLHASKPLSTKEWDRQNKNRSRTDLVALELIEVVDGRVLPRVDRGIAPEDALRHAAMKAPMIQATRLMLIEDPEVSSLEIGTRLGEMFQRDYNSKASKIRVGGAIRRWSIWLEPHLVGPDATGRTATLFISAKANKTGKGAPSLATPENLMRAQAALDSGLRAEDVAKIIGISRSGIYEWGKRGWLKIQKASKK